MKDSYDFFFQKGYITKEQFFKFGLEESIYIETKKAEDGWEELKNDLLNNRITYIRGYGRNGSGTELFQNLYSTILENSNIKEDPTNNAIPERVLNTNTNFRKNIKSDTGKFK